MINWILGLLGFNKVKVIIDNNDIVIKKGFGDKLNPRNIIKSLNSNFNYISISSLDNTRYTSKNVWLTNEDVRVRGDKYIWNLTAKYFDKRFIEYIWKDTFKYLTIWLKTAEAEIKITVVYPDGLKNTLTVTSIKEDDFKEEPTHKFNWE